MKQLTIFIIILILFIGCAHNNDTATHEAQLRALRDEITIISASTVVYNIKKKEWPINSVELKKFYETDKYSIDKKNYGSIGLPSKVIGEAKYLSFYPVSNDKIGINYTSKYGFDVRARLFFKPESEIKKTEKFSIELNVHAEPLNGVNFSDRNKEYGEAIYKILTETILLLLGEYAKQKL
jgi:hypothetical protein